MAWLLVTRSAVARSWVIRMGFVTLAIAAVLQVVPSSYSGFRPSMRLDVVAPTPVESAEPAETSQTPDVMRDHPEPVTLATEAIPFALPDDELAKLIMRSWVKSDPDQAEAYESALPESPKRRALGAALDQIEPSQ